jgi:hypothetical protein
LATNSDAATAASGPARTKPVFGTGSKRKVRREEKRRTRHRLNAPSRAIYAGKIQNPIFLLLAPNLQWPVAAGRDRNNEICMALTAAQRFEETYDKAEPRAYFGLLAPLNYRMPAVVSGYLLQHGKALAAVRGQDSLTAIDFACGFGAIGLLLKHDLSLDGFYAHYGSAVEAADDAALIAADRQFFASRRRPEQIMQVVGIDIAERAIAYAEAVGAVDRAFAVNLLSESAPPDLAQLLREADLVIESGAVGALLAPAMDKILGHGGRPWLLLAPRGDADDRPLRAVLAAHGYRIEHCNRNPIFYRRFADAEERAGVRAAITALGRRPASWMDEAYFKLNLWLARPATDCAALPIEELALEDEEPS